MRHLSLLLVGLMAIPALGGVIRLQDGTKLEGDIKKTDDGYRITAADGKVTNVTSDKIASIDLQPSGSGDAATNRLASLRRAVENLSDIKIILDRYKSFLDQNAGTPAAQEAEKYVARSREPQA